MGSRGADFPSGVFYDYAQHSSGQRISTESFLADSIRAHHPDHTLTIVAANNCDLWAYANVGHAKATLDTSGGFYFTNRVYQRPPGRVNLTKGSFGKQEMLAKYDYEWQGHTFLVYNVEVSRGYERALSSFILHKVEGQESAYGLSPIVDELVYTISEWAAESHNEIWIFDNGCWQKSKDLYDAVQDARWEDVILDEDMKKMLVKDVEGFFDGKENYKRFGVAWQRGLLLHGTPGNGKTISIKAIMRSLSQRVDPIPSLYVKSFANNNNRPQLAIAQIFRKAREVSPCFLVLEDLDSLVTDAVRSYFLNEVDGLQSNDGILILGSTNHLDKLDPAIVKRPSRFDRKYPFHPPVEAERLLYAEYWITKLESVPEVTLASADCPSIAAMTEGFTFAYMKEAFIATLFHLFSQTDSANTLALGSFSPVGGEPDADDRSVFLKAFEKQIGVLREQMGDEQRSMEEGTDIKVTGNSVRIKAHQRATAFSAHRKNEQLVMN
ncbi:hypothetical protein MMC19_004018 [Ptychographa xylographoides]|nr:hypothetical protein [Ptychographa xylographoides]